ncbi:MAG: 30S ribosomal protein S8 [Candidatus Micrarchaeaceae archaeon]
MDTLADSLNIIKTHELVGIDECTLRSVKIVRSVLDVLKANGYIKSYEEVKTGKFPMLNVKLAKKINDIGAIKPRFAVRINDYQKYELRFIPSKNFGMLIVSTPEGIMTNAEAKAKHLGGRLLAYVY